MYFRPNLPKPLDIDNPAVAKLQQEYNDIVNRIYDFLGPESHRVSVSVEELGIITLAPAVPSQLTADFVEELMMDCVESILPTTDLQIAIDDLGFYNMHIPLPQFHVRGPVDMKRPYLCREP